MNNNRSQNRALAIIGIVAIVLGLGVGLLWAGVGSTAPSNPSAPVASNQTSAQNPSTTSTPADNNATPGDSSTIPTVVTGNTGEAASSSGNNSSNANPPTPDSNNNATSNPPSGNAPQPTPTENSSATSNPPSGNATTGSANPASNSGNGTTGAATGSATPTSGSGSAKPKHQKTTAPKANASGTPVAGKGKAAGKVAGKTAGGTTAGKANPYGNQVPVAGVVDSVDAANKLVVLDTNFGPLTATLATTATIQRQPLPGDTTTATGPVDLSNVQVGNYAIVLLSRDQLPKPGTYALPKKQPNATPTPGATGTPGANDQNSAAVQAKNQDTLLKRRFGIRDGFSATVSALRVGPAPASIEASDSNPLLGLHAIPASFVSLESDGNIIATITRYGDIRVVVGSGTRFDRLGQPISVTDLKPGDSIILYGEAAWVGSGNGAAMMDGTGGTGAKGNPAGLPASPGGKGTGSGRYANGLPVVERIAELHVVTPNEHVLQGKLVSTDTSANTFQISSASNETFTVNVAADTKYQSLAVGQSVSSLADLQPGSSVVVYTIGDSDIDPKIYNAKTVDLIPATK